MTLPRSLLLFASGLALSVTGILAGSQQVPPAGAVTYTEQQARSGLALYAQQCAGCHRTDLRGSADAPALSGADFAAKWGPRAANDLFTYLAQTMPPTNPGGLGEQGTIDVAAYLLQANGIAAGARPLTPQVSTTLNAMRAQGGGNAVPVAGVAPASGNQGPPPLVVRGAGGAARDGGGAAVRYGVTLPGEVKNYVPVTPEMLKNPPPGDWLIFRRNYLGWSYSPLDQITSNNVRISSSRGCGR